MKIAINILKQEHDWVSKNRDTCPHSDEYYEGYKEAIKHNIGLLEIADMAGDD